MRSTATAPRATPNIEELGYGPLEEAVMGGKQLQQLRDMFVTSQTGWERTSCMGDVVLAWAPADPREVYSLALDGMPDREEDDSLRLDPCFAENGHVLSLDAEWATSPLHAGSVAPNGRGEHCCVLCAVAVYRTYPVTPCNEDFP